MKQFVKVKSLIEVESEVKAAIWRTSGQLEHLLHIQVTSSSSVKGEFTMKMEFETAKQKAFQEKESKSIVQRVWLEENE